MLLIENPVLFWIFLNISNRSKLFHMKTFALQSLSNIFDSVLTLKLSNPSKCNVLYILYFLFPFLSSIINLVLTEIR